MPVTNGTILVACGTIVGVTDFLIGRYLSVMPAERVAQIWKGRPISVDQTRRMGMILMISGPILFLVLAGVGVSGMAG